MLRNLLTRATRTSTQLLSPKTNNAHSAVVVSKRLITESGVQKRWTTKIIRNLAFVGGGLSSAFGLICGYELYDVIARECKNAYCIRLTRADYAAWEEKMRGGQPKMAHPMKGATVKFYLGPSWITKWFCATDVLISSTAYIVLPNATIESDYVEICEWLARRDIQVEQSESGARLGLTKYALQHMRDGVDTHIEDKCGCRLEFPPKKLLSSPTSTD